MSASCISREKQYYIFVRKTTAESAGFCAWMASYIIGILIYKIENSKNFCFMTDDISDKYKKSKKNDKKSKIYSGKEILDLI